MRWFKSLKEDRIKLQLEQEQLALYKSELAAREAAVEKREQKVAEKESELAHKEAAVAERERNVTRQEYRLKVADEREQEASEKIREAEDLKRDLKSKAYALDQRAQALYRDNEIIIARRVEQGIKGREIGLNDCWRIIKRKFRVVYNRERNMYTRAILIAAHLGIPLKCILTPREKKLADQVANELTEEHYALIDLVMSCPDDQAKDLLKWMQRFPRS